MLVLVIPTFNEEQNVVPLMERVDAALDGITYKVIFVDDSNDSTPEVIHELMAEMPWIQLIHREKDQRAGGLSTAVLEGFYAAVKEARYICVMDADLQHPPEKIRELLESAQNNNADIVVASRYIKGGKINGLNGPVRKLVSILCAWIVRVVFLTRIGHVSDPLGGFFLVKSEVISRATLRPFGFKILLDVLMRTDWQNLLEIPYQFCSREHGESKATLKQGMLFFLQIFKIISDKVIEGMYPIPRKANRSSLT